MTKHENDNFVERCKAVGLGEGSLFTWLEKVEAQQAEIAEYELANEDIHKWRNSYRSRIDKLLVERDESMKDAGRFNYLTKNSVIEADSVGTLGIYFKCSFEHFDNILETIDAAIKEIGNAKD